MNKIVHYLQEHVTGEVTAAADARRYFSTDKSIFELTPALIVYPRSENDVRKTTRFSWQLAERHRVLPITARGGGSDQSGAAIGQGIVMVFPAHMNRIVELDPKSGTVTVEPGANYGSVQQTLETHGRFLPPCPSSAAYSTIGGAIANNASGANSVKYGDTRSYVRGLRVVLANGEVIVTERLNKRDLTKKLGLTTFEGEVYRSLDALLEENLELIASMNRKTTKNAAGYDLADICHKDGSFDLTPLFVGSQGTLGIVTEATLDTEQFNPERTLVIAHFSDVQHLQSAVMGLKQGSEPPSAIELVDGNLLQLAASQSPAQLKGLVSAPYPKFVLLVEYDDNLRSQKKNVRHGVKLLERYSTHIQTIADFETQETLWKLRQLSGSALSHTVGNAKALPFIEDGAVPIEQLAGFIQGIYEIFERMHLPVAIWGHAGDGHLHVQPNLDLSQLGDRQKAFRLMDDYYKLVISLGGTTSGEHSDGRVRGPYLEKLYGSDAYVLLQKVKKIFDPYGILNPGVKIDVSLDDLKPLLRQNYSLDHLYKHLPRS